MPQLTKNCWVVCPPAPLQRLNLLSIAKLLNVLFIPKGSFLMVKKEGLLQFKTRALGLNVFLVVFVRLLSIPKGSLLIAKKDRFGP